MQSLSSHWAVTDTWFKRSNDMSAIAADLVPDIRFGMESIIKFNSLV